MMKLLDRLSGTTAVLLAAFMWSLSPLLVKSVTVHPLLIVGLRAALGGLMLTPFFHPRQITWSPRLLLLCVPFCFCSVCAVFSFRYTAAANATALYYSAPLWIFLATCLSRRHLDKKDLIPVLLLLAGIVIILAEPKSGVNKFGDFMGLCAGACFAAYSYSYRRIPYHQRLNYLALCNMLAVPLVAILVLLIEPAAFREVAGYTPRVWLLILVMTVTQPVLPFMLYSVGLAKLPLLRASMLSLGEFVLAPIWTLLLVADIPSSAGIAGWLLILGGLLLNLRPEATKEKAHAA